MWLRSPEARQSCRPVRRFHLSLTCVCFRRWNILNVRQNTIQLMWYFNCKSNEQPNYAMVTWWRLGTMSARQPNLSLARYDEASAVSLYRCIKWCTFTCVGATLAISSSGCAMPSTESLTLGCRILLPAWEQTYVVAEFLFKLLWMFIFLTINVLTAFFHTFSVSLCSYI
jgi:hypothetical protein